MKRTLLCLALLLTVSASAPAAAQSVVIIVHPNSAVTSITKAELSKIFLKRLRTWANGEVAMPVDQPPSSEARAAFTRWIHGRSVVSIEVYWKRMVFSGRALPPPELASDEKVLEFVQTTPGAVGYVIRAEELEGVRVLAIER